MRGLTAWCGGMPELPVLRRTGSARRAVLCMEAALMSQPSAADPTAPPLLLPTPPPVADIFLPSVWFRNAFAFSQDRPTGYKIWALPPPDTTVMWLSVVQGACQGAL